VTATLDPRVERAFAGAVELGGEERERALVAGCGGDADLEAEVRSLLEAHDRSGGIRAGEGGLVLMPLYQAVGNDGFFLIRRVHRSWLLLSGLLRRLGSERWLWLLPGIRRVDEDGEIYRVDRRVARWYALELLHLLGFRRQQSHEKHIIVRRRDD